MGIEDICTTIPVYVPLLSGQAYNIILGISDFWYFKEGYQNISHVLHTVGSIQFGKCE